MALSFVIFSYGSRSYFYISYRIFKKYYKIYHNGKAKVVK